jgi:glycine cleavage system protein P-like pyridoxal-binding family
LYEGAGPVGVSEKLAPFVPETPTVERREDGTYYL